jgi:hypothetical protein
MKEFTEDQYRKLKAKVETNRAEAERAKGALAQIKDAIHKEFGCKTIKQAKRKLVELTKEQEEREAKLTKMIKDYEKKWNEPRG